MALARGSSNPNDLIDVRRSKVHGLGVFAARRIPKGRRIIEYVGERVSHKEADRRYEEKDANDSHTFLFIVDSKTVIDAGVDGNEARFFNHSCDPNCESVVESRRVYIEAIRNIEPGDELTYDYQIQREKDDPPNVDEVFACRCGFKSCRGTMLWPTKRPEKKGARARSKSSAVRKSGSKSGPERKSAAGGKSARRGRSAGRAKSAVGGKSSVTRPRSSDAKRGGRRS